VTDLNAALLAAHDRGDMAALARLYTQAADAEEAHGNADAACFYLTQALVYSLAAGTPDADALQARLATYGRDETG